MARELDLSLGTVKSLNSRGWPSSGSTRPTRRDGKWSTPMNDLDDLRGHAHHAGLHAASAGPGPGHGRRAAGSAGGAGWRSARPPGWRWLVLLVGGAQYLRRCRQPQPAGRPRPPPAGRPARARSGGDPHRRTPAARCSATSSAPASLDGAEPIRGWRAASPDIAVRVVRAGGGRTAACRRDVMATRSRDPTGRRASTRRRAAWGSTAESTPRSATTSARRRRSPSRPAEDHRSPQAGRWTRTRSCVFWFDPGPGQTRCGAERPDRLRPRRPEAAGRERRASRAG